MDTIGSIQLPEAIAIDESQRHESFERLRYLASEKHCGVLVGQRGSGKSALLRKLQKELERDGLSCSLINLAGVSASELPMIIAAELGLGLPSECDAVTTWSTLQDYAVGCRQSETKHVLIFDQIDRAPAALAFVFERLLSLFESIFACLFATRPKYDSSFRTLFKNHSWMRVRLDRLSAGEVSQVFAKRLAEADSDLQVTKEAVTTVQSVTNGRADKLRRLTELAVLAAEAEEIRVINEEIIRSIQSELKVK